MPFGIFRSEWAEDGPDEGADHDWDRDHDENVDGEWDGYDLDDAGYDVFYRTGKDEA